jgi:hypothetical protein
MRNAKIVRYEEKAQDWTKLSFLIVLEATWSSPPLQAEFNLMRKTLRARRS